MTNRLFIINFFKLFANKEPVLFWTALAVILNSAQVAALPVTGLVHSIILIVAAIAAAMAARYKVEPIAKSTP